MNWTEVSSVVDWAMTGRDHFFFDVLLTFLACFATVIYGTLCKSGHGLPKDPPARTIVACIRVVKLVSVLIMSVRFTYTMVETHDILITLPSELALIGILFGDIMLGMLVIMGHEVVPSAGRYYVESSA